MKRLDVILFEKSLVKSRTSAKECITKGLVTVNGKKINKPSFLTDPENDIITIEYSEKYVSRGAYKLLQAFDEFKISVDDMTVLDAGASTGGFTQVLLEKGAKKVYAIDVGSDQLDKSLKEDVRVVCLENTDIRDVESYFFIEPIDFVTCDLSFISLEKTAMSIFSVMRDKARAVFLIKPQFEVGRINVGKKGIVKNENIRLLSVKKIEVFLQSIGFSVLKTSQCNTKGRSGNTEYLVYIEKA